METMDAGLRALLDELEGGGGLTTREGRSVGARCSTWSPKRPA